MIYEDTYNFMMNKASAKEIDILLSMVKNVDWDNVVRLDDKELARLSGTTVRYVREVNKRLMSIHKGKRILTKNKHSSEYPYKLLLGTTSVFYRGENYAKKYRFLYEDTFQQLNIYEKRIILNAVMDMSITGQNKVYLKVSDFIYRNEVSAGKIPNKDVLVNSIDILNNKYNNKMKISYASNIYTKEEVILVEIDTDMLEDVEENRTERRVLRELMFKGGYSEYLEDEQCTEIEKMGKYIYQSLLELGRETKEFTDTILYIARKTYTRSVKKLARTLKGVTDNDLQEGGVSAYFSSIVFTEISEEMTKYDNEYRTKKGLMEKLFIKEDSFVKESKNILKVLRGWIDNWIKSRYKDESDRKIEYDTSLERNNRLKDFTVGLFTKLLRKEDTKRNPLIKNEKSILKDYIEQVDMYIDIRNEALHPFK